jgi:hypothetical protein
VGQAPAPTAPRELFGFMGDWLKKDAAARAAYPAAQFESSATTRIGGRDGKIEETVRYTKGDGGRLCSVECRPVGREANPTWLILLTGRAVRHIGPNRIWVRIARELAAKGFASLRLDGRSVGDSDGEGNGLMPNEEYYQEHIYDDIENVMGVAVKQGAKKFLMTGICSGATASYQIAWRRNDVKAIVLLNLLQLKHDPEDDEAAVAQQAAKFAFRKELWLNLDNYKRLFKVGLSPQMRKVIFSRATVTAPIKKLYTLVKSRLSPNGPSYIVTGYNELAEKKGVAIDVFLSQGDLSVNFIERHFGPDLAKLSRAVRVHRVEHTDHTIRALHAQEHFFEVLRAAVARVSG